MRLARNRAGQQGLASTRRADEQRALGQFRAYLGVLAENLLYKSIAACYNTCGLTPVYVFCPRQLATIYTIFTPFQRGLSPWAIYTLPATATLTPTQ